MPKLNGPRQNLLLRWSTTVRLSRTFYSGSVAHDSSKDPIFLILYRELYYRHVYSRLQPNIDDRFHSYENSCELFNYLLSKFHNFASG